MDTLRIPAGFPLAASSVSAREAPLGEARCAGLRTDDADEFRRNARAAVIAGPGSWECLESSSGPGVARAGTARVRERETRAASMPRG